MSIFKKNISCNCPLCGLDIFRAKVEIPVWPMVVMAGAIGYVLGYLAR